MQATSISDAEIIVVDDCSTDEPESVVAEFDRLQVAFVRHGQNLGPCENFCACVRLASRPWLHILHGDDVVLPHAYSHFREAQSGDSKLFAVFGRNVFLNKDGDELREADGSAAVSPLLGPTAIGRLDYNPLEWSNCPVQFAGVLFSLEAIDAVGTFDCRFGHVQDWNLWWRMALTGRVAYTNAVVGGYRYFEGNHTSTLRRSAQNLDECLVQLRLIEEYQRRIAGAAIPRGALYGPTFVAACRQCMSFAASDRRAFWANLRRVHRWPRECRHWRDMARLYKAGVSGR